jgi:hypothetical protein
MFGSELWWKGANDHGTTGRAEDLQPLVNQKLRATTGAFRTTNQGAHSLESGIRAATAQPDNRRWLFGLRLRALPEGDQAKALECTVSAWGYSDRVETTVIPPEATPLLATIIIDREAAAKRTAEGTQPVGLSVFTDGYRRGGLRSTWLKGEQWKGHKVHMGFC